MRQTQKGGYSFLVYDGIRNASLLLPFATRQAWRLLSSRTRSIKSNTKARRLNKSKRKTRKNRS